MRFSCDQCGRSYVAADEVSRRAFRMRCKECGHEIVVRPQPPAAEPAVTPSPSAMASPSPNANPLPKTTPTPRAARRRAFDPFEGENAVADVAVSTASLEILDKTPSPLRLPAPRPATAGTPAPGQATPRAAAPPVPAPRGRRARMLPAEDEEMLGPPGDEGRREFPRWVIAAVVAALVAGGILLAR